MSDIRLSSEAVTELVEAAAWYAAQRTGLEEEPLDEVERILPLIADRAIGSTECGSRRTCWTDVAVADSSWG